MSDSVTENDFKAMMIEQKAVEDRHKALTKTLQVEWIKIDILLNELKKTLFLTNAGTKWIQDESESRRQERIYFQSGDGEPKLVDEYLQLNDEMLKIEVDVAKSLTELAKKQQDGFEVAIKITRRTLNNCFQKFQDSLIGRNGGFYHADIVKLAGLYKGYYLSKLRSDELQCQLLSSRGPSKLSDSTDSVKIVNEVDNLSTAKRSLPATMTSDLVDYDSYEDVPLGLRSIQKSRFQSYKLRRLMPSSDEESSAESEK